MRRGIFSFLLFLIVFTAGALSVAFTPPRDCTQQRITQSLLKPGTLEIWYTGSQSVSINTRFNSRNYLSTIPHGKPLFTGADLDPRSLSMGQDELTGYYFINFTMKGMAAARLTSFTSHHIGSYITITLNNVVVSSPMIGYTLHGKGQFQMAPRALALLGIKCAKT
jgi:preprotein translocase subunit SecD